MEAWLNGRAEAHQMSDDPKVLRRLFSRKGYAGMNSLVYSENHLGYNHSRSGRAVLAIFRLENITKKPIKWTVHYHYTCHNRWKKRASAALDGEAVWSSGKENCKTGSEVDISLTILPGKHSLIFSSTSSVNGRKGGLRSMYLMMAFGADSLSLPQGLRFLDDLQP